MLISDALEVGIGLSFMFFLASLILASIHEMIETVVKARGKYLYGGIVELLQDPLMKDEGERIAKDIYQHPLIRGLMRGDVDQPGFKSRLPSYLPTRSFVLALVDQVTQGKLADATSQGSAPADALPLQKMRMMSEGIRNQQVRTAVIHAIDTAQGDIDIARDNLGHWFDSAMDRVSGWYKRRSQRIIFALGLITAVCLNVNTIIIAQSLSNSETLRKSVVAAATAQEKQCIDDPKCVAKTSPSGAVAELNRTNLPVGWTNASTATVTALANASPGPFGWIEIAVGYLLTAFAVALGAPFWFDVLNRLMVIRATVKPAEKSPDEASQDAQPAARTAPVINNIMPPNQPVTDAPPETPPPPDSAIYLAIPDAAMRLFEDDLGNPVAGAAPELSLAAIGDALGELAHPNPGIAGQAAP